MEAGFPQSESARDGKPSPPAQGGIHSLLLKLILEAWHLIISDVFCSLESSE